MFKMSQLSVTVTQWILYFGLQVSNQVYVEDFFDEKMSWVEKSFFSLRALGEGEDISKITVFLYSNFFFRQ